MVRQRRRQALGGFRRVPPRWRTRLDPGDGRAETGEFLRDGKRHVHVLVVVLVHPRLENASHLELLDLRDHRAGGRVDFRSAESDEVDLVAGKDAESIRDASSDYDAALLPVRAGEAE